MMSGNTGNTGQGGKSGKNSFFGFNPTQQGNAASGLEALFGGLFGNSDEPYDAAGDEYKKWIDKAEGVQNPFLQAGTGAIGDYNSWLGKMSDPTSFINNIMGQYNQSPYAKYLTQQAMRAGTNAASASGLIGSTPFAEQMQQTAGNIASGDMNQWLQNVLGINTQYGQGKGNLIGVGANSANALTNLFNNSGQFMGQAAYGKQAGQQQDMWNTIGGMTKLATMFL